MNIFRILGEDECGKIIKMCDIRIIRSFRSSKQDDDQYISELQLDGQRIKTTKRAYVGCGQLDFEIDEKAGKIIVRNGKRVVAEAPLPPKIQYRIMRN